MGSFQQICLGGICLAAAYMFGNYVNNNPPLNSAVENPVAGFTQFGSVNNNLIDGNNAPAIPGNIQSRLPISNFAPIENKPAPIVTMKTPLKSRFAVPTIQKAPTEFAGPAGSQTSNPLPPPSQLAAPNPLPRPSQPAAPNQLVSPSQQSKSLFSENAFSSGPFTEPVAVSPTVQVPDFSAIAAEFKNTPIELPNISPLGGMPSYSSTNRPEPNQFGNWHNRAPANPQLKQLVRQLPENGFRNPNIEHGQRQPTNPQPHFDSNVEREFEPWNQANTPQRAFSQTDFEPNLNENLFGLKPKPEKRFESTPDLNNQRLRSIVNNHQSSFEYDYAPPPVPAESQVSGDRTASGFRGNLTFRPEFENRLLQSRRGQVNDEPQFVSSELRGQRQRRPNRSAPIRNTQPNFAPAQSTSRLPFGLTDQAKTELVQLRDRADSMIGLESTNFVDHTIKDGETLQSISSRYFGSPNYYLDIYLANRNKLRNPADTRAGVSIRVPVYQSN